jgi:uncharacterized ion transporter superfamily protein YfcC
MMKHKTLLILLFLSIFAVMAFFVFGQGRYDGKLPQGTNSDPLEARIKTLESKIVELEQRIGSLEKPSPKLLPTR